jgi:sugar phosphate isomerase/epimerase
MKRRAWIQGVAGAMLVGDSWSRVSGGIARAGWPPAFHAMDTCTRRPYPKDDIPPSAQLDLLRELGYAGIAWTEEGEEGVRSVRREAEARGLKIVAIYCGAAVKEDGTIDLSPQIPGVMRALAGHGAIVWLHIGGKGRAIGSLSSGTPLVGSLRALAEGAAEQGLSVAIYPHVGDWTERFGDAVQVARVVDRPAFGVCFNLCHALATGDGGRVEELLREAGPLLKLVTLNGADEGVARPDWSRLIQPLDAGSYDVRGRLLEPLRMLGYGGAVALQGYGITIDRRELLSRSKRAWDAMVGRAENG